MTIRSNIDAREANRLYTAFEEGCANAPEGTFEEANVIRDMLGDMCDAFINDMRSVGIKVCNSDGIREIEVLMFDNIRRNNPTGIIPTAIGFGLALQEQSYQIDRNDIIQRVRRDGDFYATREEWQRFGLIPQDDFSIPATEHTIMSNASEEACMDLIEAAQMTAGVKPNRMTDDEKYLLEGEGEMWEVRVISSADSLEWCDFQVRAVDEEEAASKAEAVARRHADLYFGSAPDPTYNADRDNIYRMEPEEQE